MWRLLAEVKSRFYKWFAFPRPRRELENESDVVEIKKHFSDNHETYGSPRITIDLNEARFSISENLVARLMKQSKIPSFGKYSRYQKKFPVPDNTSKNKLKQEFSIKEINKVGVADIPQIQKCEGWLYLSIVQDFESRRIVG